MHSWIVGVAAVAAMLAVPVGLRAQTYTITATSPSGILTTANGQSLILSGTLPTDFTAVTGYSFCFYAGGFGASATPLAPTSTTPVTINVPASTIQSIPSQSFNNAVYNATVYVVKNTIAVPTSCAGGAPDPTVSNALTVPIETVPSIVSYSLFSIPQTNPGTNIQPPPYSINLLGGGFQPTSTVNFAWAGGNGNGAIVKYVSQFSMVVTFPTIPAGVTSITPTVCNAFGCGSSPAISLTALQASSGTLAATPSPATVQQSVLLSSVFTPSKAPVQVNGAPSGNVVYSSGGVTIGTGHLLLDKATATLNTASTENLTVGPQTPLFKADFNGDGLPDIAFLDTSATPQAHIELGGTPYGTFQSEILIPLSSCVGSNSMAAGDLNRDGFTDLVVNCVDDSGANHVYAMLSNGDGTFAAPVAVSGIDGAQIALGDVNGDGKLDLVVYGLLVPFGTSCAAVCPSGFAIFTGNGDGTFTFSTQFITTATPYVSFQLADIDADGFPDVVGFNNGGTANSIDIYRNSQSGTTFGVESGGASTPTTSVTLQNGATGYFNMVVADFNQDGRPDLALTYLTDTSPLSEGIQIALNTSPIGGASFGPITSTNVGQDVRGLAAADFNGDGINDLVLVTATGGALFYEGDGKGAFANTYPNLTLPDNSVLSLLPLDINDDGYADLAVINTSEGSNFPLVSYITSGSADASFSYTPTQAGQQNLTGAWAGNVDFTGSSANFALTVNAAGSNTSIGGSLNTTTYGQSVTLSSAVTSSAATGTPTGTITFLDNGTPLTTVNMTGGAASLPIATLPVGKNLISAVYSGDTVFAGSTSGTFTVSVNRAIPTINWTAPAAITYGTALTATQLNATATGPLGAVAGTFVYTPVAGTVLGAGSNQALGVTFTPTDGTDYTTSTGGTTITVNKATTTVTWTQPANIIVGTPLSATQLNATATGPQGAVAGTFVYTPASGTVLQAGANQALSVAFTPTDATDYSTATGGTTINVIALAIGQLTPASVTIGSAATTVTLTGTGFLPNSVVSINGAAVATTYISPTSLSVVIPAANLLTAQTLKLTVNDPTQGQTSTAASFAVVAPAAQATFTGPTTVQPAQQPTLNFTLTAYPVPITGTVTLTFAGNGGVDDPSIQFSTGGRTQTFTIPANSTTTPTIQLQSGTDAGTITVTLTLSAAGQVITPASVVPVVINLPAAPPVVTSMTLTRSGDTLTANIMGYSNTRDLSQATFTFTGANGDAVTDPQVIVPATALFTAWFSNATSQQYGSTFLYTQEFNLNNPATSIGSVAVTLTNSTGTSTSATAQ